MNIVRAILCVAALIVGLPIEAQADTYNYPCTGTVQIAVPLAPGGANDTFARHYAHWLSKKIDRNVIILNLPNVRGGEAVLHASAAKPDGCTLLLHINGLSALKPMYGIDYVDLDKFDAVSTFASNTALFVVNGNLPVRSLDEFVAFAKQKQEGQRRRVNIAGASGSSLISALLLVKVLREAGVDSEAILFKSEPEAVQQTVAGNDICCVFAMATTSQKFAENGLLRILAIADSRTSPIAPGVPPITTHFPSFEKFDSIAPLSTILIPKGATLALRERLGELTRAYLTEPETVRFFGLQGAVPVASTQEDAHRTLYEQQSMWEKTIYQVGIQKQSP